MKLLSAPLSIGFSLAGNSVHQQFCDTTNFLRLVKRMLKAGITEDYRYEQTEEGSGQRSVCSPVIANIYMHYVLTWWFEERVKPRTKGYCGLVVYADGFVVCFQYKAEAERVYESLRRRKGHFGLSLEEEKSRLLEFGRYAAQNREHSGKGQPETFNFLGFTHFCSKSRNGKFRVKRKTSRKKLIKKCREVHQRIKEMRTSPVRDIINKLNRILVGYFHYYGITDNFASLNDFCYKVRRSLFFWLKQENSAKELQLGWVQCPFARIPSGPSHNICQYLRQLLMHSLRKEPDARKPHVRLRKGPVYSTNSRTYRAGSLKMVAMESKKRLAHGLALRLIGWLIGMIEKWCLAY